MEFMEKESTVNFLYKRAKDCLTFLAEENNPQNAQEKYKLLIEVFKYNKLLEHSINLLSNSFKGINKPQTMIDFLNKEQILVNYLYSMCRECDEIKYLYEKIIVLKYMREFIFSKKKKQELSENDFNDQVQIQLKAILKLIWEKKKMHILEMYEEYNDKSKNQLTEEQRKKLKEISVNNIMNQTDFWDNHFYETFKVGDITKFILKLLKLYDIDHFFGNVVFFDKKNVDPFGDQENRSIKKIDKLLIRLKDIESQILQLRVKWYLRDDNKNFPIFRDNDSSALIEKDDYKLLYHSLCKIQSDSLDVFNFELYDFKSTNSLYQMLWMENKTFYKKIDFLESMKSMIIAITYFNGSIDKNILGYISNLLRIFSKMIEIYPDFNATIKPNFNIYSNLIISPLKCISNYESQIQYENEFLFLQIIYRTLEIFIYLIKNSSMKFEELKDFMKNVFSEIHLILPKFKTKKNKLIYRILYLLGICKALLYLYINKKYDSSYDSYSYKTFFDNILKTSEINKYFITDYNKSRYNYNLKPMETIKEENSINQESEDNDSIGQNDIKPNISFDLNIFPEEVHPIQLDNSKEGERSKKKKLH